MSFQQRRFNVLTGQLCSGEFRRMLAVFVVERTCREHVGFFSISWLEMIYAQGAAFVGGGCLLSHYLKVKSPQLLQFLRVSPGTVQTVLCERMLKAGL